MQDIPFLPEAFGKFVTSAFTDKAEIMAHYRAAFAIRPTTCSGSSEPTAPTSPGVIFEARARSLVETSKVQENSYVCIFPVRDGSSRG